MEHSGVHRVRLLRVLTAVCTGIAVAIERRRSGMDDRARNLRRRREAE